MRNIERTIFNKKHRTGRFSKEFDKFGAQTYDQVYQFCLLGMSNDDLAKQFEVDTSSIDRWIKKDARFRSAVHAGREIADAQVASSLYKRANGFYAPEDEVHLMKVGKGRFKKVKVSTLKHYAPDTKAAHLWLMNRQRARWAATQKLELGGAVGTANLNDLDLTNMSDQELALIESLGIKLQSLQPKEAVQ